MKITLLWNPRLCGGSLHAVNMAKALIEQGVNIEIDGSNKCPWFEHPILYAGDTRITGDKVIDYLVQLGTNELSKKEE